VVVTYLVLARLPEGGPGDFDAYESAVLPLLAERGGRAAPADARRPGRGAPRVLPRQRGSRRLPGGPPAGCRGPAAGVLRTAERPARRPRRAVTVPDRKSVV